MQNFTDNTFRRPEATARIYGKKWGAIEGLNCSNIKMLSTR